MADCGRPNNKPSWPSLPACWPVGPAKKLAQKNIPWDHSTTVGGNGETPSSCFMFISIEPWNSWTIQNFNFYNLWMGGSNLDAYRKNLSFAGGKHVYDSEWRFLKVEVPPNHPNFDNFHVETIWSHVIFFRMSILFGRNLQVISCKTGRSFTTNLSH